MGGHMDSRELTKIAYNALDDKKAFNTRIIDISEISVIADYFVIASANNTRQVQALADNVQEWLYKQGGVSPIGNEGYKNAEWILLDYGDIIIHIFNEETRGFYELERIWKDGKVVEIGDL
jgi:ribosome-associated protein